MIQSRIIPIGPGHEVSAVLALPDRPGAHAQTLVVLAHGAGNDMHSPFLSAIHSGLAARGFAVVKFNFPYKERGGRAPDPAPVLEACYRRVLECLRADAGIGPVRVVIGGKSLGGRIASHLAAAGEPVSGLVFLGYPLHPAGKPQQLRVAHLPEITAPMLFVAGTRDPLARLDLLRSALARLPHPVTLHLIDGADHSFSVLKSLGREPAAVWDEIVETCARWLDALP